jgi:uncharacterized protein YjbJ (UPF0337 family)
MIRSQHRPSELFSSEASERISDQAGDPMGEIIDKTKGKIKQAAGIVAGDKKLQQEGKVDEAKGKAKGAVEEIKHAVKQFAKN